MQPNGTLPNWNSINIEIDRQKLEGEFNSRQMMEGTIVAWKRMCGWQNCTKCFQTLLKASF